MSVSALTAEERARLVAEFNYCLELPCGEVHSYIQELDNSSELQWVVPKLKAKIKASLNIDEKLVGVVQKVETTSRGLREETFQSARDRLRAFDDAYRTKEAEKLRKELHYLLARPKNPLFGRYLDLTSVSDKDLQSDVQTHLSEKQTGLPVTFTVTVERKDTKFRVGEDKKPARQITITSNTYSSWDVERSRGLDTVVQKRKVKALTDQIDECKKKMLTQTSSQQQLALAKQLGQLTEEEAKESALLKRIHSTANVDTLCSSFSKKTGMNDDETDNLAAIALHGEQIVLCVSHDCNSMTAAVNERFWFILGNNEVAAFFDFLGNGFKTRVITEPRPAKQLLKELKDKENEVKRQ